MAKKALATPEGKAVVKHLSDEELKERIRKFHPVDDPRTILKETRVEIEDIIGNKKEGWQCTPESKFFKVLTLFEFDNNILLAESVLKMYRTFLMNFYRDLRSEYKCETPSEKAVAELVAMNFVRVLAAQFKSAYLLDEGRYTDLSVSYLAALSKESDRAQRQYLSSLQTLKMIKQPALEVNIRTQTAVVGQNQVVQTRNE